VSLEFFIDIKSFRSHYGRGVDSASNRNEYQEYFLGVKAEADNLTTILCRCHEIWNPLGHSRPVMGLFYILIISVSLSLHQIKEAVFSVPGVKKYFDNDFCENETRNGFSLY